MSDREKFVTCPNDGKLKLVFKHCLHCDNLHQIKFTGANTVECHNPAENKTNIVQMVSEKDV